MTYKELNLEIEAPVNATKIEVNGQTIEVQSTLPVRAKMAFVNFIVQNAVNQNTGMFDPITLDIYFSLALIRWYAGITFEDGDDLLDAYDAFENYGVIDKVQAAIDPSEYEWMKQLVEETVDHVEKYNTSFAGVVQMANTDASGLNEQLNEILKNIQDNKDELANEINNVVENG